jgi:hypothetical protein
MKSKKTMLTLAIPVFAIITTTPISHAVTQTLAGIISDSMCMKKHMMPGRSDADCIKECVKAGSSYVLVVGDKSYVLKGKTAMVAQYAGKHVTVQGTIDQKTVTVESIR